MRLASLSGVARRRRGEGNDLEGPPQCGNGRKIRPEAERKRGKIGGTECRGFRRVALDDGVVGCVGDALHQQGITARVAVVIEPAELGRRVRGHRLKDVVYLKVDAVRHCVGHMGALLMVVLANGIVLTNVLAYWNVIVGIVVLTAILVDGGFRFRQSQGSRSMALAFPIGSSLS